MAVSLLVFVTVLELTEAERLRFQAHDDGHRLRQTSGNSTGDDGGVVQVRGGEGAEMVAMCALCACVCCV